MTRLSVNINKVALLRNSRPGTLPDVVQFARDCESYGAQGITVHPRPDERHIRYQDVYDLKPVVNTEFNIEGYPGDRFMKMVLEVKPDQCTLVPDPPDVLTSDTGWDTLQHMSFLSDKVSALHDAGVRVSLFLNAEPRLIESVAQTGADRIELYTGLFAQQFHSDPAAAVHSHKETSILAAQAGLGLNAGHDLNLSNLAYYSKNVQNLLEVSIGHALVADALYYGLQNVIEMYLRQLSFA